MAATTSMKAQRWVVRVVVLALLASAPAHAWAAPPEAGGGPADASRVPAMILPTVVKDATGRRPPKATAPEVLSLAASLDALLTDTAQDLGLSVDLSRRPPRDAARLSESDLLAQAKTVGGYVIAPSLEIHATDIELRVTLADASSRTLKVRVEKVTRADAPVRAVVMLRDVVHAASAESLKPRATAAAAGPAEAAPAGTLATPARSAGRAVLVINATIFGGLGGYSIQRASGSEDPRVLYPLLAVGAGVGLGGSLIVAEEWDVGVGDAWFLAAGAWWPTIGAHLIYEGRFAPYATGSTDERWTFGLIGGAAGVTVATLALTYRGMGDGGAVVAHSGGAFGLVFGGLTELAIRGDIYNPPELDAATSTPSAVPFAGMGYGAVLGWLAGSALATPIRFRPARVFTVDIGAALGGVGGAALASPLLFSHSSESAHASPTQQRLWIGAIGVSALLGAGIAWFASRERPDAQAWTPPGAPLFGVIGESQAGFGHVPVYGLGWQGSL